MKMFNPICFVHDVSGPIMVNQDRLGVAGRRIRLEPAGLYETWAKPLGDGSFAALLYHRNESCLDNDDSMVHMDPVPQVCSSFLGWLAWKHTPGVVAPHGLSVASWCTP